MNHQSQLRTPGHLASYILVTVLSCGWFVPVWSQTEAEAVRHTLSFPDAVHHYVDVQSVFPTDGEGTLEIFMAVWIPGFYKVLDFSQYVEAIDASTSDGAPLEVEKSGKNRWRMETKGETRVVVTYRVYGRAMMSFGNWVEEDHAALNGAATFMAPVKDLEGQNGRPHTVRLILPESWSRSISGLPSHKEGENHYVAGSFDVLVDSPILAGNPTVYEFEVAGKKHYLANQGEAGIWDGDPEDVEKIVEEVHRFWGQFPYDRYVFMNVLGERGGGGLEHRNSTLIIANRWVSRVPKDYRRWLMVACHELFHTWNVKHLRPVELGPFDYEKEAPTTSLWIAEGLSSYYDDLLLCRAGLITNEQYLETVSEHIEDVQTTPGRKVRALGLSSYDTWLAMPKMDAGTYNSTVDYYSKGSVAGFLLDARIRKATRGEKSLDDVMRLAYERYSGEHGYTPEQFRDVASDVAGTDLSTWLHHAIETTEEYSYEEALDYYGLRFKSPDENNGSSDGNTSPKSAWLGVKTRNDGGRLVVSQVPRGTPAWEYGFNVDDEILALDDYRVRASEWTDRLKRYRPGTGATILVARHGRLHRLAVVFAAEPSKPWNIEIDPEAGAKEKKHLESWLTGH